MQAQRARGRKAVKSYESEHAPMRLSIGAAEMTSHKPHVRVEDVVSAIAGIQICSRAAEVEVALCDDAPEVEYLGGIMPGVRVYALYRAGKKVVDRGPERGRDRVRNRLWKCRAGAVRFFC